MNNTVHNIHTEINVIIVIRSCLVFNPNFPTIIINAKVSISFYAFTIKPVN